MHPYQARSSYVFYLKMKQVDTLSSLSRILYIPPDLLLQIEYSVIDIYVLVVK